MDPTVMFQISYGLYVLSAKEEEKDNGCIINTVMQVTDTPKRIVIAVNKQNLTHDMIQKTGVFSVSILDQSAGFELFQHFGYQSGRTAEKYQGYPGCVRGENGLYYLREHTSAYLGGKVLSEMDLGTHTMFVAEVTEGSHLSTLPPMTYARYQEHVKPKPKKEEKGGYRCKICGYVYEGDVLPEDFICPICKHGADDFEKIM